MQPGYGQPYGQHPYRQPPPGRPPQPPYGQPPGQLPPGYGGPPRGRGRSNQTWLVGGIIVAVVLLLLIGLGVIVVNSVRGEDLKYQATDDLCKTFDPDSFDDLDLELSDSTAPRSSSTTSGNVEELGCDITYQPSGGDSGYASLSAKVEIHPTARRAEESHKSWMRYEGRTQEAGRETREITGLGQAASAVVKRDESSFTYQLRTYDDNLTLSLRFYGGDPEKLSSRDVDKLQQKLVELSPQIMSKLQVAGG